ncbi:general secretion pathway protein [Sulfuricella sp. T08]|uniref:AAA family ATPase n=1 Tax=Sulfuricella sp. T08 TaxID=1632857 RepID=UPI00061798CA|nr:AAA family ATPase [Sulfuricella sp. T08]GAO35885.1 general secretion pathway protein [Sulfuricella sp. T08]
MYLDHFGLNQSPFKITPNTEFFYTGGNRGAILDALLYAITHGEGIVKVTGEIGSGKTMLCRMLESILPDNVEAIYLANPSLNRDEVFHAIAGELGLATEGKRGGEIMRLMQNCLIEKHAASKQVVLLVEEAQAMPLDTLEEIRLLSNLETAHHKLLQIVLFGQPELDDHLNLPQMRQLKERITHGFKVPPLDQKDIPEYLMFRMRAAGYHGPNVFSTGAIKLITSASQGITRRINVLADKALLAAFSENTHNILPKHTKAAIEDSEFAPSASTGVLKVLKKIGIAATLIGLGIAVGAGWQHLAGNQTRQHEATASAPQPVTATDPQPAPAPVAQVNPAPATNTAAAQQNAAPAPASLLQQRLDATLAWLANTDGGYYTVQLMLTDSDAIAKLEQILGKISRETGLGQIYVYPTSITAKHQFGITLGSFSTRNEAQASIEKLPRDYKTNRPMLRTVKGIRDEMARQK